MTGGARARHRARRSTRHRQFFESSTVSASPKTSAEVLAARGRRDRRPGSHECLDSLDARPRASTRPRSRWRISTTVREALGYERINLVRYLLRYPSRVVSYTAPIPRSHVRSVILDGVAPPTETCSGMDIARDAQRALELLIIARCARRRRLPPRAFPNLRSRPRPAHGDAPRHRYPSPCAIRAPVPRRPFDAPALDGGVRDTARDLQSGKRPLLFLFCCCMPRLRRRFQADRRPVSDDERKISKRQHGRCHGVLQRHLQRGLSVLR